jgi:leader peptidase (prepilin peptidase)/N-methyltransferase
MWASLGVLAAITLPLTVIDIRVHRLPNAITYPAGLAMIALNGLAVIGGTNQATCLTAFLSGIGCGVAFLALHIASKGGMGMGDVKLAILIGFGGGWLGLATVLSAIAAGFVLGGIGAVWALLKRKAKRPGAIAFGPYMLAGFWLACGATLSGNPLLIT